MSACASAEAVKAVNNLFLEGLAGFHTTCGASYWRNTSQAQETI